MNFGKGAGAAAPLQFNQESAGIDIARQLETGRAQAMNVYGR